MNLEQLKALPSRTESHIDSSLMHLEEQATHTRAQLAILDSILTSAALTASGIQATGLDGYAYTTIRMQNGNSWIVVWFVDAIENALLMPILDSVTTAGNAHWALEGSSEAIHSKVITGPDQDLFVNSRISLGPFECDS